MLGLTSYVVGRVVTVRFFGAFALSPDDVGVTTIDYAVFSIFFGLLLAAGVGGWYWFQSYLPRTQWTDNTLLIGSIGCLGLALLAALAAQISPTLALLLVGALAGVVVHLWHILLSRNESEEALERLRSIEQALNSATEQSVKVLQRPRSPISNIRKYQIRQSIKWADGQLDRFGPLDSRNVKDEAMATSVRISTQLRTLRSAYGRRPASVVKVRRVSPRANILVLAITSFFCAVASAVVLGYSAESAGERMLQDGDAPLFILPFTAPRLVFVRAVSPDIDLVDGCYLWLGTNDGIMSLVGPYVQSISPAMSTRRATRRLTVTDIRVLPSDDNCHSARGLGEPPLTTT
jgi:hypothetical protein